MMDTSTITPTVEEVCAEAVYRVDARHRGCVPPAPDVLADEYVREARYVASLARQFPWDQVVSKPSAAYLAKLARRRAERDALGSEGSAA